MKHEVLIFLAILINIFIIIYYTIGFFSIIYTKVPYIPTPNKHIKHLIKQYPLRNTNSLKIVDLGCGDARSLFLFQEAYPNIKAEGYEINSVPVYLKAKPKIYLTKNKNIQVHNKSFYNEDLSDVNIVYTYLTPTLYEKLLIKLRKTKKEHILISYRFKVPNETPTQIIDIPKSKRKFYIYTI